MDPDADVDARPEAEAEVEEAAGGAETKVEKSSSKPEDGVAIEGRAADAVGLEAALDAAHGSSALGARVSGSGAWSERSASPQSFSSSLSSSSSSSTPSSSSAASASSSPSSMPAPPNSASCI